MATRTLALAVSLGALAPAVRAQTPNFSGTWTVNVEKSDFGPAPAPPRTVLAIEHGASALKVSQTMGTPAGDQTVAQEIPLSTGESTWTWVDGGPITSTSAWEGGTLVVNARLKRQGLDIAQVSRWTMAPDGKTLTLAQQTSSPNGTLALRIVCDRKP